MFKFLCVVSIIASVGVGIATVLDVSNLPVLIACIFTAIVNGCIAAFQTETNYALSTQQNLIFSLQQRCYKLEKDVEELKRKK